ncbi:MAG TPA: ATP-binding protein, partial [Mycobacterium sp.]|uniref:AAA family ATPase n=1 Tax=Mycobacterium sp. TaxID=1785 RepID=UPI002D40D39B
MRLPAPGVTAVVGANNSGKSTLLREIYMALVRELYVEPHQFLLLKALELRRSGSALDMIDWLAQHVTRVPHSRQGTQIGFMGQFQNQAEDPKTLHDLWAMLQTHRDRLASFHQYFAYHLTAETRLGLTAPQPRRNSFTDPAVQPVHYLEDDPEALSKIKALSERLFRQTLTLDLLSNHLRLRVGKPAVEAPPIDALTREYQQALAELPNLFEQGDGMKSLLGLLVPVVTAARPIFIIDEPEAFLHPPQAAALGQVLGELATENRIQIILATHDRNLLTGLLQSEADISVVR